MPAQKVLNSSKYLSRFHDSDKRASCCRIRDCVANCKLPEDNNDYQSKEELADKHGAYNVRVFGSVARGEAGPTSDVDLVVDVQPWVGLEFLGLWDELEDLLGRKVDLLTERALKSGIRERILREAVAL